MVARLLPNSIRIRVYYLALAVFLVSFPTYSEEIPEAVKAFMKEAGNEYFALGTQMHKPDDIVMYLYLSERRAPQALVLKNAKLFLKAKDAVSQQFGLALARTFGLKSLLDDVKKLARQGVGKETRIAALASIRELAVEASVPWLEAVARDKDVPSAVRAEAAAQLRYVGAENALPVLELLLGSESREVRLAALREIRTLSQYQDSAAKAAAGKALSKALPAARDGFRNPVELNTSLEAFETLKTLAPQEIPGYIGEALANGGKADPYLPGILAARALVTPQHFSSVVGELPKLSPYSRQLVYQVALLTAEYQPAFPPDRERIGTLLRAAPAGDYRDFLLRLWVRHPKATDAPALDSILRSGNEPFEARAAALVGLAHLGGKIAECAFAYLTDLPERGAILERFFAAKRDKEDALPSLDRFLTHYCPALTPEGVDAYLSRKIDEKTAIALLDRLDVFPSGDHRLALARHLPWTEAIAQGLRGWLENGTTDEKIFAAAVILKHNTQRDGDLKSLTRARSAFKDEDIALAKRALAWMASRDATQGSFRMLKLFLEPLEGRRGTWSPEDAARALARLLSRPMHGNSEGIASELLEELLRDGPAADNAKAEKAFRETSEEEEREAAKAPPESACRLLCETVDRMPAWTVPRALVHHILNPMQKEREGSPHRDYGNFAILMLRGLFLNHAAPYCPRARKLHEEALAASFAEPGPVSREMSHAPLTIAEFLRTLDDKGLLTGPSESYAKEFLDLWTRRLLADPRGLTEAQRKILSEGAPKNRTSRTQDLVHYEANMHQPGGSLFHTYAISATALTVPVLPEKMLNRYRDMADRLESTGRPCEVPYWFVPELVNPLPREGLAPKASQKGEGVPRTLVFYLTLLQHDPLHRRKWARTLYACLDETLAYLPDMKAHHFRKKHTHVGQLAYAPYMLMPNLPYFAVTLEVLGAGNWLDAKEKRRLNSLRKGLPRRIAAIRDADGNFGTYRSWQPLDFNLDILNEAAPAYSNSFGGITLAALCAMERGETPAALYDREAFSMTAALDAAANPPNASALPLSGVPLPTPFPQPEH